MINISREEVISKIIELMEIDKKRTEINIQQKISNYGINSFNFIELNVKLEDFYNIKFDDSYVDFHTLGTIANLSDYITKKYDFY